MSLMSWKKRKKHEAKKIFEEFMAENFSILAKDINLNQEN